MEKFSELFEEGSEFPVREKCERYFLKIIKREDGVDDGEEEEEINQTNILNYEKLIPNEAFHGDMIVIGEKTLRSLNVFFVNSIVVEDKCSSSKFKLIRKLVQKDQSGSGCCCVPNEVSSRIKDPIKFYENAFNFETYDEVDFSGIEIDTLSHQELIKKFTNGKSIHPSRKCFYFLSFNEWDSSSGMFIWCDFFLDDFDSGRFLKLTPDIDESFLIESPPKIRDVQVLASSLEIKAKYEDKFTSTFLNMSKGTELEVYGITFFCPKINELSGGSVLTMIFNRIEMIDDEIVKIILNRAKTQTEDNGEQETLSTELQDEEFIFTKKIFTEYGRFGNVKLWSIENAGIISADDLNSYVICNSDLFLV